MLFSTIKKACQGLKELIMSSKKIDTELTNQSQRLSLDELDVYYSKRLHEELDKVAEETGYPKIDVDEDELDKIWNELVD
jgi:hypothetical protein